MNKKLSRVAILFTIFPLLYFAFACGTTFPDVDYLPGDFNGDGYVDVVISANYADDYVGKVFVFYGGGRGTLQDTDFSSGGTADVTFTGSEVAAMINGKSGNFNGDDYADAVVIEERPSVENGASIYIHYGSASGLDSTTPDVTFEGFYAYIRRTVVNSGDFNGDGKDDIIIGTADINSWAGRAYIYYSPLSDTATLTPSDADRTLSSTDDPYTDDFFGRAISSGDFNNDGYDDAIIGACGVNGENVQDGAVYIYYGSADGIGAAADVTLTGEDNEAFGMGVSTGDFNGDGIDDTAIGSHYYQPEGADAYGRAFIYYGASGGIDTTNPAILNASGGSTSGKGLSVGDLNGDGYDDLLMGTTNYGMIFIYYGAVRGSMNSAPDVTYTGDANDYTLTAAGDFDKDGFSDALIGINAADSEAGKGYIVFGSTSMSSGDLDTTGTAGVTYTGAAGSQLGYTVSGGSK